LRDFIIAHAPEHEGKLEIQFSAAAKRTLAMSAAEYHFEIHPPDAPEGGPQLGLQSYRIDVSRNGDKVPPVVVVVDVALVTPVVVARRPINRGQTIEG